MARRAARIDNNQTEIVEYFEKAGWSVSSTAGVADGFPDIEVGKHLVNVNIEIKDGTKAKLRQSQTDWHQAWQGATVVIRNLEDAQKLNDNMYSLGDALEWLMKQLLDGMEVIE